MSAHADLMALRVNRIVATLEAADHTSEHLDEAVYATASELATEANNGGLRAQVAFLLAAGNWKAADILFTAKEAKESEGRPRYPEFALLSAFLKREGVPPETELTFIEDSAADNRHALSVGLWPMEAERHPSLVRQLAGFWGCPEDELPAEDATAFEASDHWHGQGEGDMREFGDEFGKWDSPFFDRTVTVSEIHVVAQET